MRNPFGPDPDSGSYFGLQKRIFERLKSDGVNSRIDELVLDAYRSALAAENVVLARGEKKRLLADVLKLVLDDVQDRFDDGTSAS